MSDPITIHDLHIMMTKVNGKMDLLLSKQNDHKNWQEEHEKADVERFKDMGDNILQFDKKLSGLNKYAISVAIVAAFIGATFDKMGELFRG